MTTPLEIISVIARLIKRLKCKMACCYQSSCSVEPMEQTVEPTDRLSSIEEEDFI